MLMNVKLLLPVCLLMTVTAVNAQGLVGKLKQKANEAAEKALEQKARDKAGVPSSDQNSNEEGSGNGPSKSSSGKPQNKTGGGLVSTPPDVNQNLGDAESSYKMGKYNEARYAIQQAMLGVEMEIGQKVLKSLPEEVKGVKKVDELDQVTSTGYGWVGLTIARVYRNEEDKELKTTVANNSAWMSAVNMYMANNGYAQSTGGQQNWKQTKVKGMKAIIEYDESYGYKLSVPLGQSSLMVFEGINYSTEQEMLASANAFDIEGVKKMLGEN